IAEATPPTAAMKDVIPPGTEPAVTSPAPSTLPDVPEIRHQLWLRDPYRMTMVTNPDNNKWMIMTRSREVDLQLENPELTDWRGVVADRWIGVTSPFRTSVIPESCGWRASVPGQTVFQFIDGQTAGLRLLRGRAALQVSDDVRVDEVGPVSIRLKTGSQEITVSLKTAATRIGVQVNIQPLQAEGSQADEPDSTEDPTGEMIPSDAQLRAVLFVAEGEADVQLPGSEERQTLNRSDSLQWTVAGESEMAGITFQQGNELDALPSWIYDIEQPPVAELQDVMQQIADRISISDEPATAAVELTGDRNPSVGVAATDILVLSRAVRPLFEILMAAESESVRRAAIDGLSEISNSSAEGKRRVRDALENRLASDETVITERLIEGPTEAEARDTESVAAMMKLLDHQLLGLRELALYRMQQFTGDRFAYHADSDPARRHEAVRRWKRHVERNDGKLLP
ncbi:MAG: hypothetical protein KDA96_23435, partial [Planctomycetaceae bacterium]|nr:hypothetical protein [Planctomycetaceae bacterium]